MSVEISSEAPFLSSPSSSCYVQSIGKVGVKAFSPVEDGGKEKGEAEKPTEKCLSNCGRFASMWICEDDEKHRVAKTLDCNKEWCPTCRDSAHGRRIARWLPKAQKISSMGYLVIPFPHDDRQPKTKAEFSRVGRLITEALQRRGFKRGFRRWHFFGEKEGSYHPHLNFLIEARYMSREKLDEIKVVVGEIIGFKKGEKAVVYYQFTRSVNKIFHWIKYVTRPTFLDQKWSYELADELYNFRNCVSWGKWIDEDKWTIPEEARRWAFLVKIENKVCPVCGGKLRWVGVCQADELSQTEVCVHFPLKEKGVGVSALDPISGKVKRLMGHAVYPGGFEQIYLGVFISEADPGLVQTYKLLKSWTDGFKGVYSSKKRLLRAYFEALNRFFENGACSPGEKG